MNKICRLCGASFEIDAHDVAFYEKISPVVEGQRLLVPAPSRCPACRFKRRLSFRNQIYVYQRTSAMSGKRIYSAFPPEVAFPVIARDEWWGDLWDPFDLGVAFNPEQPFFAQFARLRDSVPHIASLTSGDLENCDYCNNIAYAKNCYLVFSTTYVEDSLYCESIYRSRDCMECTHTFSSELCYDCIACTDCYNVQSSACSDNCSDSFFLFNCRGCKNCYCCVNLEHAQYCIYNKHCTKQDYEAFIRKCALGSFKARTELKAEARSFWRRHPRPHFVGRSAERVTGNFIYESRDVKDSFLIRGGDDIRFCFHCYEGIKSSSDVCVSTVQPELIYEAVQMLNGGFNSQFCFYCIQNCADCRYCWMCVGCKDCFGCVGLKKKQYCVLNKQYTKQEYEKLVREIVELMRKTGEWGEFFPLELSPAPYNHSLAQRVYPLTREEAKNAELWWYDKPLVSGQAVDASDLPDELPRSDEALVVRSAASGALFRITSEEIRRYRDFKVPLPRVSYDERMQERAVELGGVELYERQCAETGKAIITPISPETPWIVWEKTAYENTFFS